VTLALLWLEYRAEHAQGYAYSWFCERYSDWRKCISPTMRQTHVAGEKLSVDWAGDTIPVFDAATGKNPARTSWSRRSARSITPTPKRAEARCCPNGPSRFSKTLLNGGTILFFQSSYSLRNRRNTVPHRYAMLAKNFSADFLEDVFTNLCRISLGFNVRGQQNYFIESIVLSGSSSWLPF
jgi:hypothetical protein